MTEQKRTTKWSQPWFIRRACYAIVGLVLLALAGLGFIEEGQIDSIAASPILGTAIAWMAAAKTHPGSDSTTTNEDLEVSQRARAELQTQITALQSQIGEQVQSALSGVVDALPDRVQDAVRRVYDEPYGRHDAAAPEPDPAGPGRYPGSL
ncbi:hypothetical protein [Corynebacterium kalidii]|uniref:Uncharacterized protein n=1 Tax=Corynebacterium kalidii TaxID=2931982 RepID=A0A9X1WJD6_9CORY|nr:hypothetical protein [Corynebacterium kalidii]MCJ7859283.1 hypothetical protein [Corynebacterium kalidii]